MKIFEPPIVYFENIDLLNEKSISIEFLIQYIIIEFEMTNQKTENIYNDINNNSNNILNEINNKQKNFISKNNIENLNEENLDETTNSKFEKSSLKKTSSNQIENKPKEINKHFKFNQNNHE